MGAHSNEERDDGFLRQPSHLDTTDDRVWFRTGNEHYPTNVFVIWDGGAPVAISVASHGNPDGMGVLTSLEDARDMRDALTEIITRAEHQGFLTPKDDEPRTIAQRLLDDVTAALLPYDYSTEISAIARSYALSYEYDGGDA